MTETFRTEVKKVSLTAIRGELSALWHSEELSSQAVIRARSHNLVVYTDTTRHNVENLVEHIIQVNAHRPGRVILVQYNPDVEEKLDAWVTVYCQPRGGHQVCSEMVVMEVGRSLRSEIHSTVISLLVPDLPVYLWWMQLPDSEDHLYHSLSAEASRLIVDSDFFRDVAADLPALAALEGMPLGDLAWSRLTPWRRHLARFWDMPSLRGALNAMKRLNIQYTLAQPHMDSNRALLLAGWLAKRLGWQLEKAQADGEGSFHAAYLHEVGAVDVSITAVQNEESMPGELTEVAIDAADLAVGLTFFPENSCIEVRMGGGSQRDWAFKPVDAAAALAQELDYDYDPAYTAALNQAVALLRAAHGA